MSSPPVASTPPASPGRRRAALFLLAMSPFFALLAVLVWGQVDNAGNPGGLLEHDESGEITVAVRSAPGFAGLDLISGELVDLDGLRGRVVMVDFWSSWCVSCRVEAADLADVYREYADMPVEFVGLAIWDDAGDVANHLARFGVAYPNILDESGATAVAYGVRGVPEKYFLDADGRIVRKVNGPVSAEQLREIIAALLAA